MASKDLGCVEYTLRKLDPEMCTLTVNMKVTGEFKARKAVAMFLIKCACKVLGAGLEVKEE